MPQHDLDIANASGASVRADINNALQALGTMMKGATAPSAPVSGMLWLEDDNPSSTRWTVRQYDGTDWIAWGVLDTTNNRMEFYGHGQNRTDAPSVAQIQDGGLVWAGSTGGTATAITATLTPAITAYATGMTIAAKISTACGNAPTLNVNSVGARKIYVMTASGPAQATTGDLFANDLATFRYDSALDAAAGGWLAISAQPAERMIARSTASGAAQIDLVMPSVFTRFRLILQDMTVASAGANLNLQFSSDGGSTFLTTSNYVWLGTVVDLTGGENNFFDSSDTAIQISAALPASSGNPWDATYEINPGSASLSARVRGAAIGVSSTPTWLSGTYSGAWTGTNARMTALRIAASTGNISGTAILVGIR